MSFEKNPELNREKHQPKKNYYDVLGINSNASVDEIKSAFRKRAQETHPDKPENENKEEELKKVIEAYGVLIDPTKRQLYDSSLVEEKNKKRETIDVSEEKKKKEMDIMMNFFRKREK